MKCHDLQFEKLHVPESICLPFHDPLDPNPRSRKDDTLLYESATKLLSVLRQTWESACCILRKEAVWTFNKVKGENYHDAHYCHRGAGRVVRRGWRLLLD